MRHRTKALPCGDFISPCVGMDRWIPSHEVPTSWTTDRKIRPDGWIIVIVDHFGRCVWFRESSVMLFCGQIASTGRILTSDRRRNFSHLFDYRGLISITESGALSQRTGCIPPLQPLTCDLYELIPATRPAFSQMILWSFQPNPAPDTQYCHASCWPRI